METNEIINEEVVETAEEVVSPELENFGNDGVGKLALGLVGVAVVAGIVIFGGKKAKQFITKKTAEVRESIEDRKAEKEKNDWIEVDATVIDDEEK